MRDADLEVSDSMYAVSAQVNDLEIIKVPLDTTRNFKLRPEAINGALS